MLSKDMLGFLHNGRRLVSILLLEQGRAILKTSQFIHISLWLGKKRWNRGKNVQDIHVYVRITGKNRANVVDRLTASRRPVDTQQNMFFFFHDTSPFITKRYSYHP